MRYQRLIFPGGTYFFTLITWNRLPLFAAPTAIDLLREAFQYVLKSHPFTIKGAVILPDHLHMLWRLPEGDGDYSTRWRLIKSRFTHQYLVLHDQKNRVQPASRCKKGEQAVWQRRYWEHHIRDELDYSRHLEYIHYNPVHHRLVCSPVEWKFSSFHTYVRAGIYPEDWGAGGGMDIEVEEGAE